MALAVQTVVEISHSGSPRADANGSRGQAPGTTAVCVCVCKRAGARATGRVEAPTALSAAEMVALDVERGVRAGGEVLCDAVRLAQPGASRIAGAIRYEATCHDEDRSEEH